MNTIIIPKITKGPIDKIRRVKTLIRITLELTAVIKGKINCWTKF